MRKELNYVFDILEDIEAINYYTNPNNKKHYNREFLIDCFCNTSQKLYISFGYADNGGLTRLMKRIFIVDLHKPKNRNWVYHLLYLIGYKLCNKCNHVYKHEEFYVSNKALDKCQASCKYCQDEQGITNRKDFPERLKANTKKYYENPENMKKKNAYTSARRKRIQQATPKWEVITEIAKIYLVSLENEHVDHDIPLKGVNSKGIHIVCGLHTISNLKVISSTDNLKKGNKFEILTI